MADYGLTAYDASVLVSEKEITIYFEELVKSADPKLSANWLSGELFARLNKMEKTIAESPVSPLQFAGLVDLIHGEIISGKIAKEVLDLMISSGKEAADTVAIEASIAEIIAANPDKLAEYRSGKDKLFGFFVGQAMKATGGKANPQLLNELLQKHLS
jgi:aspartyl-tRNA(Asn)/glutamyl-tRNA(Gln) amidotransferase subunit B